MSTEGNRSIARHLDEAAELLESQGANPFRVNAYRRAAATIGALGTDLAELVASKGDGALEELPTIGSGIAAAIREMLATGSWGQLDRLRGTTDAVSLLATVPGLGRDLATRIHDALDVETLEALEAAAYDGRLESVRGIGPRRLKTVRAGLAVALGRSRQRVAGPARTGPAVDLLLAVDATYREQAAAGRLRLIAPKRFNPTGEAWLPLLHLTRDGWHFTALFSNTARAHELERTRDWVVIYYYDDDHEEGQCTVVTETTGKLKGRRVIRGREAECASHYGSAGTRRAS